MIKTITTEIEVTFTPMELAQEFCDMDASQQAEFFNSIHYISEEWENPFCFQMAFVEYDETLLPEGRKIMRTIGEYGGEPK